VAVGAVLILAHPPSEDENEAYPQFYPHLTAARIKD
jgi:hypothetical protein